MGLDDQERGVWGSTLLPRGWQWRRFSDFFSDETDSARKLQQKAYEAEGLYPVIDQGEGFIGGYTSDESLVCAAEPPIVLFGDHTRCVKYIDFRFVQGADGTKVLKPVESVEPRYAYFALLALDLPDKGYSRHMKFLRASLFPCGSQEEQREVVRLIESAFSWLNRIAKEQARAVYQLPKLNRAILAKAFRGELVPQDPDDETASALLDRIRMEREGTVRSGRGRKRQNSR
jgi:type I restriction enzyme S subunit